MAASNDPGHIHKEFPKNFARDDFWSQIKRTVNGKPVSDHDIDLIVDQIRMHMKFSAGSQLLDLGCGNGALASRLFPQIARYTGVDFSTYLLGIANEYFKPGPNVEYIEGDARAFVTNAHVDSFDKVLIYGCMSYFSREDVAMLLRNLNRRFRSVTTVFAGNVPDAKNAPEFFASRNITGYDLKDPHSPIGVWWAQEELIELGAASGFSTRCFRMPPDFYGHRYRFDAVFTRST